MARQERPTRSSGSVGAGKLRKREVDHERQFSATPPIGSGSNPPGLRLFGRGQGNRQFFRGTEVTRGRLGGRSPRQYRKRTGIYRPGADAGTAYEPVAGFDPTALEGSRGSRHSARRWLFGELLQYRYKPIFLFLSSFSVRPNARHVVAFEVATMLFKSCRCLVSVT